MTGSARSDRIIEALLQRHGQTFAQELGLTLRNATPSVLFQLLCASVLYSARIASSNATRAAKALFDAGWTTPQKMAASTWEQRVRVLNRHGYARYDEKTSRMLGDDAQLVLQKYRGDLRSLRRAAEHDARREHDLLKEFKGIGDVGADIFLREIQGEWDEAYPFADKRVLKAAKALGLGERTEDLTPLVPKEDFARLASALVRLRKPQDYQSVLDAAGVSSHD